MLLVDHQIEKFCSEEHYPRTWVTPMLPDSPSQECEIINAGPLITPFETCHLGPAAYDICIGIAFASPVAIEAYVVRAIGNSFERIRAINKDIEIDGSKHIRAIGEIIEVILEPNQVVLCHSMEYVRIPPNMRGSVSMRSSFARDWLDHSAADNIWPGFQGQITFELRNNGPHQYTLRSNMRPLQLSFDHLPVAPRNPYSGLYQNQRAQLHSRMVRE